ncbi:MAG: Circadian clock protein KaiC [uncultured Chloroflexi bacterium]|uniref:non-specific serine/threonine protein kinase n=1 Tax=uncultured Chloroflexota bacterium TaxID=166587 RepID=A0A6J4H331_9CHLR|nr:MAG: Circadian clock protein KaiC [uncultured Chloroflexota bacterium]
MPDTPDPQTPLLLEKLPTGISGFDHVAHGGLPRRRTTLVAGTAGSGKTVFGAQFLAEGIARGEHGVFITFEETPEDICRNVAAFGWDVRTWEAEGHWAFVDASPDLDGEAVVTGEYDLGALLARIEHAVRSVDAKRVTIDSLGAILDRFPQQAQTRTELLRIAAALRQMGVTTVMTAERTVEYGEVSRLGFEEFVADNVIILRNALEDEKRRRTLEILKFRGTSHHKGEVPFTVIPGGGIVAIPLSAMQLVQRSSNVRVTSGSAELDAMCGGGFFRDSIILVSGATGTGKTLTVTHFLSGGVAEDERCLLFAFEESREQLFRNASGWGFDFEDMERQGRLKVVLDYPETLNLEEHLVRMKQVIADFKPNRVAVDSLSALERVSTTKGFREFVIGLTSFLKQQETTGLFTSTTPTLLGGTSVTEAHISTITDSIVLLRYVELFGEMRRGLTVLKMRGSMHDKEIREFTIDQQGMHVGNAFRDVSGILSGYPTRIVTNEVDRIGGLFGPEALTQTTS